MTFIRYIATQLAAYGIDMGSFLALVYLGSLGPIIANVFAKIAAGIFAFFVHRSFTFRLEKRKHNRKQMYRYFMLLGLNVPLSAGVFGLLLLVIDQLVIAKVLSDITILILNFWLSKTWVFLADTENRKVNQRLVNKKGFNK